MYQPDRITLADLVQRQRITGESDLAIIEHWFTENNRESDGLAIVAKLAKAQCDKLQDALGYARSGIDMMTPSTYMDDYSKEEVDILVGIQQHFMLYKELDQKWLDIAKEHLPKMKRPFFFWRDCLDYLEKQEIQFKEE